MSETLIVAAAGLLTALGGIYTLYVRHKENTDETDFDKFKYLLEEYKKLKSIDRLNYYQTKEGKKQREQISQTLKQKGTKPPDHVMGLSKGTKWWNNGTTNKRSIESPGKDFVPGRIKGEWKWSKNK